ncbi:MAG: endonuclease V [bacterium]
MFLAVDVHYTQNQATAAGISFDSWQAKTPLNQYITQVNKLAPYEPGKFYKRELPCILSLLQEHSLHAECIVIDGFVFLDGHTSPGLGKYLYDALQEKTTVIGVAKNLFMDIDDKYTVYRGNSRKPLYVSAVGIDLAVAQHHIKNMHGSYRIPTLLKKVDQLSKGIKNDDA